MQVVYEVWGKIHAFACGYGQMNMIGMTTSYQDGSGSVHFRRDIFYSKGIWPFSSRSRSHSEWGFHSVSKPELVESIIVDVGPSAASQASFDCKFFDTPKNLINISRAQEIISILQLYTSFPFLVLWSIFLHPLFAIAQFINFLLCGLLGLNQFNLLLHKDLNPGPWLSYILLVLLGIFIFLLDLLDAFGLLSFSMPEDDIPLVEDLFVRFCLDLGALCFLGLSLSIGVMSLRALRQHIKVLYVTTLSNTQLADP